MPFGTPSKTPALTRGMWLASQVETLPLGSPKWWEAVQRCRDWLHELVNQVRADQEERVERTGE